ncbi:hypothetical protein HQ29_03135 [Porphyromonas canoris]|uniref:Peptidyl-prolyl cis-trans isomerase n=1 Tax=Porphyromonas canoris TaxID=36875 RepID=A0ABR4XKZ1_9PORP|nr:MULTISPECIES: FKBP-type peptidyl-prolyl cis-trans isomerase [Porphyromonas]KGL53108.1 hypothetical protein HQ29_03135 [Porphyromonas canoris]KGN92530.1 hypothetical protein HQ43_04575 [Porphyromonas canoris]KGN95223.1 hypothetical protein HQ39_06900 [Porphyromonas sp. COT-108 OH2963]
MKKILLTAALIGGAFAFTACNGTKNSVPLSAQKTTKDSMAYLIGFYQGQQMKFQIDMMKGQVGSVIPGDSLDVALFTAGLETALKGDTIEMNSMAVQEFLETAFEKLRKVAADANKAKGEEFMAKNAKEEGVITTESGLQYKIETEGEGAMPTVEDMVVVHYKGTLLNGEVFDSSYDRGEPATFPLNGVIKGWTEGLQLVKVGSKFTLWVPAELAYGENGSGNKIGPNETLRFDCELIEIKAKEQ